MLSEDGRLLRKEVAASGDHRGADEVERKVEDVMEQQMDLAAASHRREEHNNRSGNAEHPAVIPLAQRT